MAFANNKLHPTKIVEFTNENSTHHGKRENAGYQHFFPSSQNVFHGLLFQGHKNLGLPEGQGLIGGNVFMQQELNFVYKFTGFLCDPVITLLV